MNCTSLKGISVGKVQMCHINKEIDYQIMHTYLSLYVKNEELMDDRNYTIMFANNCNLKIYVACTLYISEREILLILLNLENEI